MSDHFPIAVIEDRYGGIYSGEPWLAIGRADYPDNGGYRIIHCLQGGPHGDDVEAAEFWASPPGWIAAGATPDQAVQNLKGGK